MITFLGIMSFFIICGRWRLCDCIPVGGGVPAAAAGGNGAVPLGGNPINNGLYADAMQRQARDAARRQQEQAPRGH